MNAKFAGTCRTCHEAFPAGAEIDWSKATGARHASCPTPTGPAPLYASGTTPSKMPGGGGGAKPRTNSKAGACVECGSYVPAGKGELWWGEDGCCTNPRHFDDGGWHVTCLDTVACAENRKANVEAAKVRKTAAKVSAETAKVAREAADTAYKSTREAAVTGLTVIEAAPLSLVDPGSRVVLADLPDGRGYGRTLYRATIWGVPVVLEIHTMYDDGREYCWMPASMVRDYYAACLARRLADDGTTLEDTRERARECLTKYRGCVGTKYYEFVAATDAA